MAPLSRPDPSGLRAVSHCYAKSTGVGVDGFHPRALGLMSDDALLVYGTVLAVSEALGSLPRLILTLYMVLLAKAAGGMRTIGLMPTPYRIHMKIRETDTAPAMAHLYQCHPWLAARKGRGPADVVWNQSVMAEAAAGVSWTSATVLWDVQKCYEHVQHLSLWAEGLGWNYPEQVLRLAINTYRAPRRLLHGRAASKAVFALRSIVAGCPRAVELLAIYVARRLGSVLTVPRAMLREVTDRICSEPVPAPYGWHEGGLRGAWAKGFSFVSDVSSGRAGSAHAAGGIRRKYPASDVDANLYIDDLGLQGDGDTEAAAVGKVVARARAVRDVVHGPLGMKFASDKATVIATSASAASRVRACLGALGGKLAAFAKNLGLGFNGGKRASAGGAKVRNVRIAHARPRLGRILRLLRGGGNAAKLAWGATVPAAEWGVEVEGLAGGQLKQVRGLMGEATGPTCRGASLTLKLLLAGHDPALRADAAPPCTAGVSGCGARLLGRRGPPTFLWSSASRRWRAPFATWARGRSGRTERGRLAPCVVPCTGLVGPRFRRPGRGTSATGRLTCTPRPRSWSEPWR